MDLESKEEASIGSKSRKIEDKHSLNLVVDQLEGKLVSSMDKALKSPSHKDSVDFPDGTESEATTKIPRSVDTDFDSSQAVFVNPDEGTPAAEALAGTYLIIAFVLRI